MILKNLISTFIATATLTFVTLTSVSAQFLTSDFTKLNRFVQSTNSSDSAMKVFRVGRDLIEDEKWEQAEKRFRDFLREYPKHKEADAAIYWLAFTQKKQQHFAEAERLLVKLNNEYPKSNWLDDAKALRLEIAPSVGNVAYVTQVISPIPAPRVRPNAAPAPAVAPTPDVQDLPAPPEPATAIIFSGGQGIALAPIAPLPAIAQDFGGFSGMKILGQASSGMDEKDEIKAIALQSLMQSNPERALPYISEILKNDSKASKGLKEMAVRLLSHSRGPYSVTMLLDLARNQSDPKLRRSAIYSLSSVEDDKVFDLLSELATKSDDAEISKAALRALASHRSQKAQDLIVKLASTAQSPLVRRDAILFLGERQDDTSIERLISIYENDTDPEVKKYAVQSLSRSSNPKARQKLFDIARSNSNEDVRVQAIQWLDNRGDEGLVDELVKIYQTDKSLKVRRQAIFSLTQMIGGHGNYYKVLPAAAGLSGVTATSPVSKSTEARNKNSEKAIKALLQLYDAETDESLKNHFLMAFSQANSKEALQKLMQVAKSDSSITLRRRAVLYLGQNRDPEAAKFLEELLK